MEGIEVFLKMVLREKEKEYEAETNPHKCLILSKQIQALEEAINKGPISPTESLIKDLNWKLGRMDKRFEAIETYIADKGFKVTRFSE